MVKWFKDCITNEDVKKTYRKLIFEYHPDQARYNGIDVEMAERVMKEINAEYEIAAERCRNIHRNKDGETYQKETVDNFAEFRDILNRIIYFEGVTIELCGTWLWVSGNTKDYKDILKELNFRWSANKTAWYYHNDPYKRRNKQYSFDEIRGMWGSEEVETKKAEKVTA
jgi:curved DNA-binding protein CbpA